MQDIDKFGFNLVNLAKKENYPWSSPKAAIESEFQMSPEEFMQNSFEFFSEFEAGTEGFIGDAWTWFKNLIGRFWNWITGNNKKEKAKIEKVEEKIQTLNKEYKNPSNSKSTTNNIKEDMLRNKKEFNKAMSDPSTTLEIGEDGVKAKHVYWAPVGKDEFGVIDSLINVSLGIRVLHQKMSNMIYDLNKSKSWDDFLELSNSTVITEFVLTLKDSAKDINYVSSNLKIQSYDDIKEAAETNNYYYSRLKYIKKENADLEKVIGRFSNAIKNIKLDPKSNNNMSKSTDTVFTKFITKEYPDYKKSIDSFITKLDKLYSEAIKRNRISAKANGLGAESEELDFDIEFDDSFEPFIYDGTESFSDYYYIGTEGFMDKVKNAWEWLKNLIKRFINWITGRSKKDKAKTNAIQKNIDENINILTKIKNLSKSGKTGGKESIDETMDYRFYPGMEAIDANKVSTTHKRLNDLFDNGANIMYVAMENDYGSIDSLGRTAYRVLCDFADILSYLPKLSASKFHDKFESKESLVKYYDVTVKERENTLKIVTKTAKGVTDIITAIESLKDISKGGDFRSYISGEDYYDDILSKMDKINTIIDKIDSNNMQLDPDINKKVMAIADAVYGHILPNFQKEREKRMADLNKMLITIKKMNNTFYNKYLIALKQAERDYDDALGINDDYHKEHKKHNPNSSSYSSVIEELGSGLKDANGLESAFGFVTPSITSKYAYEGLEEEYHSIKKLLSECDAEANEYFDDYVFFGGTEGFVDTVKLYGHKIWDAIRRFFMWIASKFSDKYKEKYELEKMRALINSLVDDYADYVKYDDYHKGVQDLKDMANNLKNSLNSSEESVNIFRLTSGLESEDYTLTVTNYEEMNNSIEEIADEAKDLAKFTKYFIDMVATGRANSKSFRVLITKDLQDLPGKLNKIKFPGTKVITPKDAKEFKEDVNTAINYCKEFKTIIDYMNKHKAKVDKFFENPELKDNTLAKEMIAAMNRYFVPSVKSISNIIDWYVRCINTDIKKLKNATK